MGDSGELQRISRRRASGDPESKLREEMRGSGEVAAASGSMPIRFQWVAAKEESHLPPAPGGVEGGGARLGGVIAEVTPNGVRGAELGLLGVPLELRLASEPLGASCGPSVVPAGLRPGAPPSGALLEETRGIGAVVARFDYKMFPASGRDGWRSGWRAW